MKTNSYIFYIFTLLITPLIFTLAQPIPPPPDPSPFGPGEEASFPSFPAPVNTEDFNGSELLDVERLSSASGIFSDPALFGIDNPDEQLHLQLYMEYNQVMGLAIK